MAEENGNSQVEGALKSDSKDGLVSVHSIILDWTLVCFIDSVGAKAIKQVQQDTQKWFCDDQCSAIQWLPCHLCPQIIKEYAAIDVNVVIAGCSSK